MSFTQELTSWLSPTGPNPSEPPTIGSPAPSHPKIPLPPGQPTLITFLRHCGCPFAEKTYLNFRTLAHRHPQISFLAISHSSPSATSNWQKSLPQAGSEPSNLQLIVDEEKEAYAAWGLGVSSWSHVLHPGSLMEGLRLGREEGISNRPTESGTRWQTSGSFGVDAEGVLRWGGAVERADVIPEFGEGVEAVSGKKD